MSGMLRISENVFLKVSCIEAVELEEDGVYVYTSTSKFKTSISFFQMINILTIQSIPEDSKNKIDPTKQFVSL